LINANQPLMFYRIDVDRSIAEKLWVLDSDTDLDALKRRPPFCDSGKLMILIGGQFLSENDAVCPDKRQNIYTHFYKATGAIETAKPDMEEL